MTSHPVTTTLNQHVIMCPKHQGQIKAITTKAYIFLEQTDFRLHDKQCDIWINMCKLTEIEVVSFTVTLHFPIAFMKSSVFGRVWKTCGFWQLYSSW